MLRQTPRILLCAALLALTGLQPAIAGSLSGELILLDANFDDKPLDEPIETGGAALGEPSAIGFALSAIVRQDPVLEENNQLELESVGSSAQYARFEFLDDREVICGSVVISLELVLGSSNEFSQMSVAIREQGSATESFASVTVTNDEVLFITDKNGQALNAPEGVRLNATNSMIFEYDMNAGTYSLWVNEVLQLENRQHGVTGRGIGSVFVGHSSAASPQKVGRMDELLVTTDTIYCNGFETAQ